MGRDPNATGVNISPMVERHVSRRACRLHQMTHAREDITCRKAVSRKSEIIACYLRAVAPKAGRILNSENVIYRAGERGALNRRPGQADEDFSCPIDFQSIGRKTKRSLDLQEVGAADNPAGFQNLPRFITCHIRISAFEELRYA